MKFAVIALVAAVAAKDPKPTPTHKGELMEVAKFIAEELKEINGDLKKLDAIEWKGEQEREHEHHRHHHDGGDHHRHPHHPHRPDHHPHHPHHPHHEKKAEKDLKMDVIQLEQIVTGILKGAVDAEGFNDIATCIDDLEHVLGDATNAVKDFKAGGASNVIEGLKQVGDMIKYVKTGMSDCSQTTADW